MTQLTRNFTLEEFLCKCPECKGKLPSKAILSNIEKLANVLQEYRIKLGKPMKISSGYRCPKHNKACGGAAGSIHLTGLAADITVKGMSSEQLFEFFSGLDSSKAGKSKPVTKFKGVGLYKDSMAFTHVDLGVTKPRPNTWDYRNK